MNDLEKSKYPEDLSDLRVSIEGLPKHGFDPLDIISPPAVIAIVGLIVTVIVFVVTV